MTKDEMYAKYLEWTGGRYQLSKTEVFHMPVMNRDVYENQVLVINHLFYVIAENDGTNARYFVFYEANTFVKTENGDMTLIFSTYKLCNE